jgi:hypothetical protein
VNRVEPPPSFVRTRCIAGGGIAEHSDLPLSHR